MLLYADDAFWIQLHFPLRGMLLPHLLPLFFFFVCPLPIFYLPSSQSIPSIIALNLHPSQLFMMHKSLCSSSSANTCFPSLQEVFMPFSEAVGFFCSVHSADRRPPLSQSMTGSSRLDLISGAVSGGDGFTCCNLPIY